MCFAKGVPHDADSLRAQMVNHVNQFCDLLEKKPEEAQVEAAQGEMEEALSEDIVEYLEDHIQENLPHTGARALDSASCLMSPVGLVLGSEANHLQAGIPAGVPCLASGSTARSTPQNPETLGLCLPGGPESGREHLGQSLAAVLGLSAEPAAAVLGCADLAAGEGGGHPSGHLQSGGGRLGIAEWYQLLCGAALRKPHPGLGAPGRSGGAPPHPEGLARSPRWKPPSEAACTLLLTLDPDPPFNCPRRLSCREDTTASGQLFLLQV